MSKRKDGSDNPDKHSEHREKKKNKLHYGMQVSGRSIKSVILPLLKKKAKKK